MDGLVVIDIDVDDQEMVSILLEGLPDDVMRRAPTRYGAGEKCAVFCRLAAGEEPFVRLASRAFGAHRVEVFGGKKLRNGNVSRQFGIYGPHSYNDDGTVAREYTWADPESGLPALHEIDACDLPEITVAQVHALIDRFEQTAHQLGWQVTESAPPPEAGEVAYDITEETRFDTNRGHEQISYDVLCDLFAAYGSELRCSANFLPGRGLDGKKDHCVPGDKNRHRCVAVHVYGDGITHFPAHLKPSVESLPGGVELGDFYAFLPTHQYIYRPNGTLWPMVTINSVLNRIVVGEKPKKQTKKEIAAGEPVVMVEIDIPASLWLDRHQAVMQMTWAPGEPQLICDRLLIEGGWVAQAGVRGFNAYTAPAIVRTANPDIGPWRKHLERIYPDEAGEIETWLAHRVQRPAEKINHALVMGGRQGIGKDTLLEPLRHAVGSWNFNEVSPLQLLGRFNGFLKAVVLRVSEARDLGESDRWKFYNHTKTLMASPPDTFLIDEKSRQEYRIQNVAGVIITVNEKPSLYLPADDRRHFVAWSEQANKSDFNEGYFQEIYRWYRDGGLNAVAQHLTDLNIQAFDAKRPPRLTPAFYDILDLSRVPEDAEMAEVLETLKHPLAVTLDDISQMAGKKGFYRLNEYLTKQGNERKVGYRFEECGYSVMRNPDNKQGLWRVDGRRKMIFVRGVLSTRDRISAARQRADQESNIVEFLKT